MPNLQSPSNPTSYRRTGWQIALMLLMGINYLMDHDPRHVQYSKDQRAKRKAEKQRYKAGFVVELPDDEDMNGERVDPNATREDLRPHSPCCHPPPVSQNGKEAWPCPRGASHRNPRPNRSYAKAPSRHVPKPADRSQMRDAWTRMRAVTKALYEFVKRVDRRKKRVRFKKDVQCFVLDGDEDEHGGDYGENMYGRL
ncbi:uncharacterized protein CC84DRAFT_1169456 [Paraphaeosphaeria sporulosa]|uniref:Uncharacterized protein n=1 Tax=Paraphaeosphaeria sporulosa TaxID=1460663 RepID=A0A177BY48_9PLEO|nr:uncharacterized protein CC84DRAFT_1169456 [Paraphaeosphaeria sporulosa]OAF99326.1 hypothetical protein CC84DRAFT_1169456 [Paraphaeosphaeria sporulosa]